MKLIYCTSPRRLVNLLLSCNIDVYKSCKFGMDKKSKRLGFVVDDKTLALLKLKHNDVIDDLIVSENFIEKGLLLDINVDSNIELFAKVMIKRDRSPDDCHKPILDSELEDIIKNLRKHCT